MRILILLLLLTWSIACSAETYSTLMPQAKLIFKKYNPTSRFHEYATVFGDINGDGITDFATFIGDPNYNDKGVEDLKAVVFLGTKDKTFNFYDVSLEVLGNDRVSNSLQIKKQSLYLHRDGSGGCCSHWVEEFQFKIRNGHLTLIGLETMDIHPEGINDPDNGVSVNFLTGRQIKWGQVGKKKKKTTTVAPISEPILFKDFNYESFSDKWSDALGQ